LEPQQEIERAEFAGAFEEQGSRADWGVEPAL